MTGEQSQPRKRRWPIVLGVVLGLLVVAAGVLAALASSIASGVATDMITNGAREHGWEVTLERLELSPWSGRGSLASMSASRGDMRVVVRSMAFSVDVLDALGGDGLSGLRSASAESFELTSGGKTQVLTQLVSELGTGATWATRLRSLRATTTLAGQPVPLSGASVQGGFDVTAGPVEVRAGSYQVMGVGADALVRAEARVELREEGAAVRVSTRPRATVTPQAVANPLGALLGAAGAMLGGELGVAVQAQTEVVQDGTDLFAILGVLARQAASLPEVPR
ncbi:MAG: hypothetical protein IT379_20765 [Deltaproteobacteria bacterium]|nr:hypothetical protein [Deltaproteobacteria bacterium]